MRACSIPLIFLVLATPAAAQVPVSTAPRSAPDFLVTRPSALVTVRGSWLFARGESDWHSFVKQHLTLDSGDFNAAGFGLDINVPLSRRVEFQFAFDVNRSSSFSEYRGYEEDNGLPIQQATALREINFGGNIRFTLTDRAREIGRFVWIPRGVVPFVGGGAGIMQYSLEQDGDFVDFVDLSVFTETFTSHAWTPSAQVFGGVDIHVLKRMYVTVDGRYVWASADLGDDWIGFEPIDLAGFRLSGGVTFAF